MGREDLLLFIPTGDELSQKIHELILIHGKNSSCRHHRYLGWRDLLDRGLGDITQVEGTLLHRDLLRVLVDHSTVKRGPIAKGHGACLILLGDGITGLASNPSPRGRDNGSSIQTPPDETLSVCGPLSALFAIPSERGREQLTSSKRSSGRFRRPAASNGRRLNQSSPIASTPPGSIRCSWPARLITMKSPEGLSHVNLRPPGNIFLRTSLRMFEVCWNLGPFPKTLSH